MDVYGCLWRFVIYVWTWNLKKVDTCHVGPRCVDIPGVNAGVRGWCLRQRSSCAKRTTPRGDPRRRGSVGNSAASWDLIGFYLRYIHSYPHIPIIFWLQESSRIYISVTNPATHQKEKVERLKSAIHSVYECLAIQPQHIYNLGKLV